MIDATTADLLERVDEGIDTLEERLASPRRPLSAEDRVLVTTLLLSLDEVVQRVEAERGQRPGVIDLDRLPGDELGQRAAATRQRLEGVTAQVTRELQADPGTASSALSAVVPLAELPGATSGRAAGGSGIAGRRLRVLVGQAITLLGLVALAFLFFAFVLSGLLQARDQRRLRSELETGFTEQTVYPIVVGEVIPRGSPIAALEIPALDVEQVVVEGSAPSELERGPGHLRTSPLPGQPGNVVLAGKRSTYGAPFSDLGRLEDGDEIIVTTRQGEFTYEVEGEPERVRQGQADDVLAGTDDARLTLVTADPALVGGDRLAVSALLDGDPVPRVQGIPLVVADDEVGAGGDASTVALLVVWAQLFVVAVVVTRLLYQRWARWPTWLLTTPVLVALLFLVFENLDSLLPAAL